MNSVILSALIGAACAIQSEAGSLSQSSASSSVKSSIMDLIEETMPTDIEGWGAEYEELLLAHAAKIFEETIGQLEIDSPLLEVCEKGANCRLQVDETLAETIKLQWATVLTELMTLIESVTTQTEEIISEGWDRKVQCFHDWPCCTFGQEYQANVKKMMRTAKTHIMEQYNNWAVYELTRMELHDTCPETTPQSCDLLPICWDGTVRSQDDWPNCSCPEYSPIDYPCPLHECSELHDHHEQSCQCVCKEQCALGIEQDVNNCMCVNIATAAPPSSHLVFFPGVDMAPMSQNYPEAIPQYVPWEPKFDNPMNTLCYLETTCQIGFQFNNGDSIFAKEIIDMGGVCEPVAVDGIVEMKFTIQREGHLHGENGVHPVRRLVRVEALDADEERIWGSPICRDPRYSSDYLSKQSEMISANARFVGINYQELLSEQAEKGEYFTYNTKFAFEVMESVEQAEANETADIVEMFDLPPM